MHWRRMNPWGMNPLWSDAILVNVHGAVSLGSTDGQRHDKDKKVT